MSLLVSENQSLDRRDAIEAVEKVWKCPECSGKEFDNQGDAINHYMEEHQ